MAHEIFIGADTNWPKEVIIYTDGACRGNPGPSSLGITVSDLNGELVYEYAATLGQQTNNFAEYSAVQKALELARDHSASRVILRSDSQLLVRQLTGEYKVKAAGLKPLFLKCREISRAFENVKFEHVRREFNKRADALANQVLDEDEL